MRILIPVDGSSFSNSAVSFIASRDTFIETRPEVELVNVQYRVPPHISRSLGKQIVSSYYETEANKVLKPALASLKKAKLQASGKYVVGDIKTALTAIAAADAADLILMGSHGHTGLKKVLFGSMANMVLASCTTPLLMLRGKPAPKKDSLKVCIALDGSKYGTAAVRFFIKNRDLFGADPQLSIIHVVPDLMNPSVPGFFGRVPEPSFKPEQAEAMQDAAFENAMTPARKLLVRSSIVATEVRLSGNNPGDQIAKYSTKNKFDLVMLGSHGEGALKSTMLGSVATRVVAQCSLPLLFIR